MTYQDAVNKVRILSHTSGNTSAVTDAEILVNLIDLTGKCFKDNWKTLFRFYVMVKRFNVTGTAYPYTVDYSAITPYMDKFIGAIFLKNCVRTPIVMVQPDELERRSKLTSTTALSVIATQYDGYLSMYVGGSVFTLPEDITSYMVDVYYTRQPILAGITTSNYSTEYIDLPDNYVPDLIDKAVAWVEGYKE
jgi:hypothetical protein